MINQAGSINGYAQTRAFSDFKQPQNGSYFIMPDTEDERKREHKYGKSIALWALGVGFGALALTKGLGSKKMTKLLDKWRFKLAQKAEKGGKLQNFYRFTLGKISSFRDKFECINNFTTIKDVLFQKLMFKTTFTRKIHEGITRLFNKISRKTVNTSYAQTHKKFASLNEYMQELNEKILQNNPNAKSALDTINQRMQRVNNGLNEGFGINARNNRLKQMNDAYGGLFDDFCENISNLKNFRSRRMYDSYIAETHLQPAKMKISKDTAVLRNAITHDINDSYKAAVKAVDNIQSFISPVDMETNRILNVLRGNLDRYSKLAGKDEIAQRAELNKEIIRNLKKLSETFSTSKMNYGTEAKQAISSYISNFEQIISQNSKGELQEILTEYKRLLPRSEYLKLKAKVKGAVKSLDQSIDTETVKYFDKARDLVLGAAPTDVLTILGTAGLVGWFMGKAKNKDERISASLRYGIPAVGTVATSLFLTSKLISGGKALILSLIIGKLINIAGGFIDDERKKYSFAVSLQSKKPR